MKPIRVTFISVVPSPYQRDLFRALAAEPRLQIDVCYMEDSAPDSPWPHVPLASYERRLPGFWFPLGSARIHLNWHLPTPNDYDIIVLNTLMSITAQRLMRSRRRQKPWVFWGERLNRGGLLHQELCRPLHHASGIAGIGTWAVNDYRGRFPEPRHYNIPYHCDIEPFLTAAKRQSTPSSPQAVTYLFCGQMIARKGLDVLLAAFERLPDSARLLLVGRVADLPNMLSVLPDPVRKRIRYEGFQPPDGLPEFFAQADVFVLPSRYDGWGVVVNQALAAGLPIVCSTQVGAGYDLVKEGINGFRFETDDIDALANCLDRFLSEPELISKMGSSSREGALEWDPSIGAKKWVRAIEEMVSEA